MRWLKGSDLKDAAKGGEIPTGEVKLFMPENISEFRDAQRELLKTMDPIKVSPNVAYQRLTLWLLAEIACELKGFK